LVVLASGCVGPRIRTYSGDKLTKSEVAVIKGRYYFALLYYDCIDIKVIGSYPKGTQVQVLPGWHELIIRHYVINLLGFPPNCVRAAYNFEAGHEYRIKAPLMGDTGDLVEIIDVNTGVTIFSEPWSGCPYSRRE
jgi:hypothetical protein